MKKNGNLGGPILDGVCEAFLQGQSNLTNLEEGLHTHTKLGLQWGPLGFLIVAQ